MNILHMRYAVEVARAGSINRAAESLLIAQPNLSRSVKELEEDLGIIIFDRSARGMSLTPQGKDFIEKAQRILDEISEVEVYYRSTVAPHSCGLEVCGISSPYIVNAFSRAVASSDGQRMRHKYSISEPEKCLNDVLSGACRLGIVRIESAKTAVLEALAYDKGLKYERISEYRARKLFSVSHTEDKTQVHCMATLFSENAPQVGMSVDTVGECLQLLSSDASTFAYCPPIPRKLLDMYSLTEGEFCDGVYCDVLIYRAACHLNAGEKRFCEYLRSSETI